MLELVDVRRVFRVGIESHVALADVSFEVGAGERVGIIGESGSGKSTLVRLALGLDRPDGGVVRYEGTSVAEMGRRDLLAYRRAVQWIGQDTGGAFNPRWTVRQTMMRVNSRLCGLSREEATSRIEGLTARMGLDPALLDRRPGALSGGQRQRFAIVRAVLPRPRLLLADEAVSALDVSVQAVVLNLLREYCEDEGCALLFVSHGLPATAFMTTRILVMRAGRVVESGPTAQVLRDPQHDYARALVDAYTYSEDA
ncbi:ABC transporter ATP-binding protein [Microbacterium sp. SORGH_AS_0888]|uniref:ABC transporter ATP-binding protein n=1 Tax=Microbacterium sp. SORGH_AS_0888 TaxID=3041791 RepID=UPI0027871F9C|nr:ATP-binding cassette domain-containing protein [Microbacterium sp. SORGH_AS_0888]MDQ1130434.1 ABC-type dipeptide/oligopeptide/nickel transport system ATPase subunit [Microbacterium sp. SORGH_AS_0888]